MNASYVNAQACTKPSLTSAMYNDSASFEYSLFKYEIYDFQIKLLELLIFDANSGFQNVCTPLVTIDVSCDTGNESYCTKEGQIERGWMFLPP